MSSSGYRLFVVSLHDNQMRDEQPFTEAQLRTPPKSSTKPPTVNYLDVVVADVAASAGLNFNIGLPEQVDDETNVEPGKRVGTSTRLLNAYVHGSHLRLDFKSGPIHSEGLLADPMNKDTDTPMLGKSTMNDFRASLTIKKGAKRAILGVETRGASCPSRALTRAMASASVVPWRLRAHDAVADAAALQLFIDNGTVIEAELTEWLFDSDGHRSSRERALTSKVKVSGQEKAKKRLKQWRKTGRTLEVALWKKEAAKVKGDFYTAKVDLEFNDVALTVENNGQQRKFKPSTNFDRFTYQLNASERAGADDFYSAVEDSAALLINKVQN